MVALLVSIGIIQIAGYWFAGAMVNGDGPLAIPQPDTALYLQSAERVAAGHPFSFSEGNAVSTGSTTVLHPFVFAIPALLGLHGDALITAFFWINAFLYLAFLLGWGMAINKCVADSSARIFACALLALFPQTAYSAMAMSDIGLWLGFSGVFAAALACERRWLYGSLLIVAPWIRPEGMVLAMAFLMVVSAVFLFGRKDFQQGDGWLAVCGILSMLGVFALNHFLTGTCQFSSVARKGYFFDEPFSAALCRSTDDLMKIARAVLFGQTSGMPRHYYMIPIVGGMMFWIGAFAHDWKGVRCWRKYVLPLAMAGGVWTVATSSWQNTNVDRYLAWIMPLVVILMAEGYSFMSRRFLQRIAGLVFLALPLLFAAGSSVVFWCVFNSSANECDQLMKFGRELDRVLPADASIGLTRHCGIAFALPDRRIAMLTSIYDPAFKSHWLPENFETLKNHPRTRFTHWLFAGADGQTDEFVNSQTNVVIIGCDSTIALADWTMFDRAALIPTNGVAGLGLVYRMDVGDVDDESRSMYESTTRYGGRPMRSFSRVGVLGDERIVETGKVIWGFDEMFVPLTPGKDVTVVMRTMRSADSVLRRWIENDYSMHFDFGGHQKLAVAVNGTESAVCEYSVSSEGFTDAVLHIPGDSITEPVSRIGFMGDHIACCYWFFQ